MGYNDKKERVYNLKDMTKTEIKKALYKQKPTAKKLEERDGAVFYDAIIRIQEEPIIRNKTVFFKVPFEDMGDGTITADFEEEMEAQLLIRYLIDEFEFTLSVPLGIDDLDNL